MLSITDDGQGSIYYCHRSENLQKQYHGMTRLPVILAGYDVWSHLNAFDAVFELTLEYEVVLQTHFWHS